MNQDTIQGNWNELKGKIKTRWAKFSDDDLRAVEGNLEQIAGRIQKVYGYSKEKAQQEFDDFKKNLKSHGSHQNAVNRAKA